MPLFNKLDSEIIISLSLLFANSTASFDMSIPIKCLFNDFAETQVVPLPQNGSNTTSPWSVVMFMI